MTTLCYIEKDGKYLMLHRVKKENDLNKDKWIGIGGHFLEGESPEECLLREVKEETGLTLVKWKFRGMVTFVQFNANTAPEKESMVYEYMMLYTATGFTGTIKDCDEGDLVWVEKEKVAELPIWEGDKIFLRLLSEDSDFFSLKLVYEGDKLSKVVLDGENI